MKKFSIKVILGALLLLSSSSLYPTSLVTNMVDSYSGQIFSPDNVKVEIDFSKPIGNLVSCKLLSSNPFIANQKIYADSQANYMTVGSEVTTNSKRISAITDNGTLVPPIAIVSPYFNLQPYVIDREHGTGKQLAWVDMENRYAIIGGAIYNFGADVPEMYGTNSTSYVVLNTFIPQDLANYYWSERHNLGFFLQGDKNAPRTLYVFGDPNDFACNNAYLNLKPYVTAGELRIYWSMIYIGFGSSIGKIFAIYDGKAPKGYPQSPTGALAYNEDYFYGEFNVDEFQGGGAIFPIINPSFSAINIYNRNQQFFVIETAFTSPVFFYLNTSGTPSYLQGVPGSGTPTDYRDLVNTLHVGQ